MRAAEAAKHATPNAEKTPRKSLSASAQERNENDAPKIKNKSAGKQHSVAAKELKTAAAKNHKPRLSADFSFFINYLKAKFRENYTRS